MSKYVMNKLMRAVEMSDTDVAAYVADPSGYVDRWMEAADDPVRWGDDRGLTPTERNAFAARDFEALYVLGAHPYLLWHFTEAVCVHESSWPELVERYRTAVGQHEAPDYTV